MKLVFFKKTEGGMVDLESMMKDAVGLDIKVEVNGVELGELESEFL